MAGSSEVSVRVSDHDVQRLEVYFSMITGLGLLFGKG